MVIISFTFYNYQFYWFCATMAKFVCSRTNVFAFMTVVNRINGNYFIIVLYAFRQCTFLVFETC